MFRKAILATVAWLVMLGPGLPDAPTAQAKPAKHKPAVKKSCDDDETLIAKKKKKKKHCKKKKAAKKKKVKKSGSV
jgi:hypothetical protein